MLDAEVKLRVAFAQLHDGYALVCHVQVQHSCLRVSLLHQLLTVPARQGLSALALRACRSLGLCKKFCFSRQTGGCIAC